MAPAPDERQRERRREEHDREALPVLRDQLGDAQREDPERERDLGCERVAAPDRERARQGWAHAAALAVGIFHFHVSAGGPVIRCSGMPHPDGT